MKKNLSVFILFSIVLFCVNQIPTQSAKASSTHPAADCTSALTFCVERFSPFSTYVGFTISGLSGEAAAYAWYLGSVTGTPLSTESACFLPSSSIAGRAVIVVVTDTNGCTKTLTAPTVNNTSTCTP